MRTQKADERIKNYDEVELGYNEEEALAEAERCLNCKNPRCVQGCPVNVKIPEFIMKIKDKKYDDAKSILLENNNLPGVCGRVCPQENQCQKLCVLGIKKTAISIGRLERFASDNGKVKLEKPTEKNGKKVAIVGSGPAGLTCAADLIKEGFEVDIFEALHKPGGVLVYGIPAFRLPKDIIFDEVKVIEDLGVNVEYNAVVGKTILLDELEAEYDAVFLGVGAGLPKFLGIPGENKNGTISANEFLTRVNLMKAYKYPEYETPIQKSKCTVVIGGGNVAMDSARCARRLGSEVHIVYRRTLDEMPARLDEVHHAQEEGIIFDILSNPVEIIGDKTVTGIKCQKMELGEPDDSGRRRPVPVEGEFETIECDQVIVAIGRTPNPLLVKDTDLELTEWGLLKVNDEKQTSNENIFAGGDIARGETTVIEAMGDGKAAAKAISKRLKE